MKANVAALTRKPPRVLSETFTDPANPAQPIPFTLRQMDLPLFYKSQDLAREKVAFYLEEGTPFPPYLSDGIELSEPLIDDVAKICVLQAGPAEDRYEFEELVVIMATCTRAWLEMQQWAAPLMSSQVEETPGKSLGAPTPTA